MYSAGDAFFVGSGMLMRKNTNNDVSHKVNVTYLFPVTPPFVFRALTRCTGDNQCTITGRKNRALQVPPVVPYKAL